MRIRHAYLSTPLVVHAHVDEFAKRLCVNVYLVSAARLHVLGGETLPPSPIYIISPTPPSHLHMAFFFSRPRSRLQIFRPRASSFALDWWMKIPPPSLMGGGAQEEEEEACSIALVLDKFYGFSLRRASFYEEKRRRGRDSKLQRGGWPKLHLILTAWIKFSWPHCSSIL